MPLSRADRPESYARSIPNLPGIAGTVLRVNLRDAIELTPTGEVSEDLFGHGPLRRSITVAGMRRDHDHAQFDLLFRRKLVPMLAVILVNFDGRNDLVFADVFAAHCLHNHALALKLLELAERVVLRL